MSVGACILCSCGIASSFRSFLCQPSSFVSFYLYILYVLACIIFHTSVCLAIFYLSPPPSVFVFTSSSPFFFTSVIYILFSFVSFIFFISLYLFVCFLLFSCFFINLKHLWEFIANSRLKRKFEHKAALMLKWLAQFVAVFIFSAQFFWVQVLKPNTAMETRTCV
jgi:hypothetical protein